MGIMVITDVERSDIEFISRTLAVKPCAHIDTFTADKLGCVSIYLHLSIYLNLYLYLYHSVSLYIYLFLYLSFSVYVSISTCLDLDLNLPVSISISISISVSHFASVSVSLGLQRYIVVTHVLLPKPVYTDPKSRDACYRSRFANGYQMVHEPIRGSRENMRFWIVW